MGPVLLVLRRVHREGCGSDACELAKLLVVEVVDYWRIGGLAGLGFKAQAGGLQDSTG